VIEVLGKQIENTGANDTQLALHVRISIMSCMVKYSPTDIVATVSIRTKTQHIKNYFKKKNLLEKLSKTLSSSSTVFFFSLLLIAVGSIISHSHLHFNEVN
jgi:hypothetical protein